MKKLIVMACLAIGFGSFAQEKPSMKATKDNLTTEQRQEKKLQKMEKDLDLTPDQTAKMKKLISKAAAENAEIREKMKGQMKAKKNQRISEMKAILTPEQFSKLEENIADRKVKMQEKRADKKAKR